MRAAVPSTLERPPALAPKLTQVSAVQIDAIDRRILNVLRGEGRITNQALAEQVHLSPRACLDRVRRLENSGVIEGYAARIAMQHLGYGLTMHVQITLRDLLPATRAHFQSAMLAADEVLSCHRVSAHADYVVRMACIDMAHYQALSQSWLESRELGLARLTAAPELMIVKDEIIRALHVTGATA